MKKQNKKRLIAEVPEQFYEMFKSICDNMGADMKEVIILGLKPGVREYVKKHKERLTEIEKNLGVEFWDLED